MINLLIFVWKKNGKKNKNLLSADLSVTSIRNKDLALIPVTVNSP